MQNLIQEYEQTLAALQGRRDELQDRLGNNRADDHDLRGRIITLGLEIVEMQGAIAEMRDKASLRG